MFFLLAVLHIFTLFTYHEKERWLIRDNQLYNDQMLSEVLLGPGEHKKKVTDFYNKIIIRYGYRYRLSVVAASGAART